MSGRLRLAEAGLAILALNSDDLYPKSSCLEHGMPGGNHFTSTKLLALSEKEFSTDYFQIS